MKCGQIKGATFLVHKISNVLKHAEEPARNSKRVRQSVRPPVRLQGPIRLDPSGNGPITTGFLRQLVDLVILKDIPGESSRSPG